MIVLAHGGLGWYDELIYLGIAVIFLTIMGISWFQTRMTQYDDDQRTDDEITPQSNESAKTDPSPDRFTLD